MNERIIKIIAATGLIIGGLFGMAGSFAPSDSLRSLAWGIDGIGLVTATALLTIFYFRRGSDITAAGFLIFAIGEGLILSSSGPDLTASAFTFGTGTGLWAASLFAISLQKTYPLFIRITGLIAAILFFIVAIEIFVGNEVNALTRPLPFFAYAVFVITLFGWAWTLLIKNSI